MKARSWAIESCADSANATEAWADRYLPRLGHHKKTYGVSVVPFADMANHDDRGSTLAKWVGTAGREAEFLGYAMSAPKRGVAHGGDPTGTAGYAAGGQIFTPVKVLQRTFVD